MCVCVCVICKHILFITFLNKPELFFFFAHIYMVSIFPLNWNNSTYH